MSLVLIGSQDNYKKVRHETVNFLEPASTQLKTFCKFAITEEHVANSKILENTIWATDIEILAIASMPESNIFVFSAYVDHHAWQHFRASELRFHIVCALQN